MARWTLEEDSVIREKYQELGAADVARLLVRSLNSIRARARKIGVSRGFMKRVVRQSTPEIDEKIRAIYAHGGIAPRGQKKALADRSGRSHAWIYRRALALGLVVERTSPSVWTEEESMIVEENSGRTVHTIKKLLAAKGYIRSVMAICCRIQRKGWERTPADHWTASEFGRCMGVSEDTVLRWISSRSLHATKASAHANGYWEISRSDAKIFMVENAGIWDHRRVDKWFLIDTLTYAQRGNAKKKE